MKMKLFPTQPQHRVPLCVSNIQQLKGVPKHASTWHLEQCTYFDQKPQRRTTVLACSTCSFVQFVCTFVHINSLQEKRRRRKKEKTSRSYYIRDRIIVESVANKMYKKEKKSKNIHICAREIKDRNIASIFIFLRLHRGLMLMHPNSDIFEGFLYAFFYYKKKMYNKYLRA